MASALDACYPLRMETLPAVAKNIYYSCNKCETERYHRVLAHLSSTEAKLECEVCGSKKKLNIGKKMATKKKTTRKKKATKSHADEWNELKEKLSDIPPEVYSIRGSFPAESLIDHPTFGLGVVTSSHANKIEVIFEEGIKTLMHRREA